MAKSLPEIMTEAFATRKPATLKLASPQERASAKPNECHDNAEQIAKIYSGEVVEGWLRISPGVYCRHSVVSRAGVLLEVTTERAFRDSFLPAASVPEVPWIKSHEMLYDPAAAPANIASFVT